MKKMEIKELSQVDYLLEEAIDYFWKEWGNDSNRAFYKDCMVHSLDAKNALPKFYLGFLGNEIIGSYALLTNDIISRQDLMPWFACLLVNEDKRGCGYGEQLLKHGLQESNKKGFDKLYLSSDLINFYEKKGWTHSSIGYNLFGDSFKIYEKSTLD